jgi:uncharacterized membrane protein
VRVIEQQNGATRHEAPRVHLPDLGPPTGDHPGLSALVPPDAGFYERQGRQWTWESWARRLEYGQVLAARSLDCLAWLIAGGLVGLAVASVPLVFTNWYDQYAWQPIGAACGAFLGIAVSALRWKRILHRHAEFGAKTELGR